MLMFFLAGLSLSWSESPSLNTDEVQDWLDAVVLLVNNGAWCSGAFINDTGLVATAYHCVASGRDTIVETRDGQALRAETVAVDPRHDLALIQLAEWPSTSSVLQLRQEKPLQGESVYALGHPLAPYANKPLLHGTLQWSISSGIVSAVGQRLIQVDAPLNPGNSGGPIVDKDGKVIGIASRKLRGDNLSFLGPATELTSLIVNPDAHTQQWWGGQLALGLGYVVPLTGQGRSIVTGQVELIARDRWLWSIQTVLDPSVKSGSGQWVPANSMRLSKRFRLGTGEFTSFIDCGAGLVHQWTPDTTQSALVPSLQTRIGLGGTALRLDYLLDAHSTMMMSIDLQFPGVVQVF